VGMSVGAEGGGEDLNNTINTTPLVDVMLVLLIIFLITVPAVIQAVPVALPKANNIPTATKPENVIVAVDRNGGLWWYMTPMKSDKEFLDLLVDKARQDVGKTDADQLVEVHIRADADAPFRNVGKAIWLIQRAGITKVGFISEPIAGKVERYG
jgi:biopolymer transport protein ExbD